MVSTSDGFEIAEVDLKLRGPGDLMGTQQSGVLNLKIADIVKDNQILKSARFYAKKLLAEDPEMKLPENKMIGYTFEQLGVHKNIWNYIS
jgi:ATP-dependent DNA helicase RecG